MTTTEMTGAEEVAWDLSDLYSGGDDPRIEQDVEQTETAAAAFRERYYGRIAELSAADLREAIEERERIESTFTRAIYYAHLWFSTDMNDSPRGALVARLTEKGAAVDTQLLFFGLELAALEDEQADALLASGELERLAPLAQVRAEVPPVCPDRARGEDPHREVRLRLRRLGSSLRRAPRGDQGRSRRGRDRVRGGDGEAVLAGSGSSPAGVRGRHRVAGARAAHPDVRLQHHRRRQVDRRPPTRIRDVDLGAQPLERHDRRRGRGADRRGGRPLRRRPALLHAQGQAARARQARVLRSDGPARRGHDAGRMGRCKAAHPGRVRRLLDRDGRHRRALLRRELDRRSAARRKATRRVLRDERPWHSPVRLHELHGRPSVRPDARARARAWPSRLPRAAARSLQRLARR